MTPVHRPDPCDCPDCCRDDLDFDTTPATTEEDLKVTAGEKALLLVVGACITGLFLIAVHGLVQFGRWIFG